MSHPLSPTPLNELQELGLISQSQCEDAKRHPLASELTDRTPLTDVLVWMTLRSIVDEAALQEIADGLRARFWGDELRRRSEVMDEALSKVAELKAHFNGEHLATLLKCQVITLEQHERALRALPADQVLSSPAALFVWMRLNDLLPDSEMAALRQRVEEQAPFASGKEAEQILSQADTLAATMNEAMRQAQLRAVFPGGVKLWLAGAAAFVVTLVWWVVAPSAPPGCDDTNTRKTVSGLVFRASIAARSDPMNLLNRGSDVPQTWRLGKVREVGYAEEQRTRGCIGEILVDKEVGAPYAFTIKPNSDQNSGAGGFVITGANPELIQARYGHLDDKGRFSHQAEPLGRAAVEQALRDGVDQINAKLPRQSQRLRMGPSASSLLDFDADRQREIAEVEPLAPCQQSQTGGHYRCRLMIERNDPLLTALGQRGGIIIEGEFSFDRDDRGEVRVSETFSQEYAQAIVRGRVDAVRSNAAALSEARPDSAASAGSR